MLKLRTKRYLTAFAFVSTVISFGTGIMGMIIVTAQADDKFVVDGYNKAYMEIHSMNWILFGIFAAMFVVSCTVFAEKGLQE